MFSSVSRLGHDSRILYPDGACAAPTNDNSLLGMSCIILHVASCHTDDAVCHTALGSRKKKTFLRFVFVYSGVSRSRSQFLGVCRNSLAGMAVS